jgi:hypothetical protein
LTVDSVGHITDLSKVLEGSIHRSR